LTIRWLQYMLTITQDSRTPPIAVLAVMAGPSVASCNHLCVWKMNQMGVRQGMSTQLKVQNEKKVLGVGVAAAFQQVPPNHFQWIF
jgi:hypothetical protein